MRDEYWSQGIERDAGDARTEAERIVDALHDIWQRQPSEPAVTEQQVVAALAAAIEEDEAEKAVGRGESGAIERLMAAVHARQRDLSALRARAGEEPR